MREEIREFDGRELEKTATEYAGAGVMYSKEIQPNCVAIALATNDGKVRAYVSMTPENMLEVAAQLVEIANLAKEGIHGRII